MITSATANNLGKQIKAIDIISTYPETSELGKLTSIGSIAQGATVNDTVTKQLANESFAQGQFFKAFSKVSFDDLTKTNQSNGDETWSYSKTINGINHSVTMTKSDILSSITLTEVNNQSEIDEIAKKYNIDKEETYISVDGKKYFVRMNIPLHFGTGSQTNVIMDTLYFVVATEGLSAAIAGVVAAFGVDAFTTVLININSQVFKVLWSALSGVLQISYAFLQAFVGAILGGEGLAAAFAAGQAAVGEAIAEGVFAAITTTTLAYTLVGILVIVGIYLIFQYFLHYSYQNVYVYNLTNYDLDFDFGYIYEGNSHNVESKHLPAYQKNLGPNNIDMGSWYSATGFRFQSDSQFYGLGYAMSLTLKEKGTQNVHKQMACMFDIPYIGKNSLRASATLPSDMKKFYTNSEGQITETQNSASDDELELIVTYDYLNGKHQNPETGEQDYIYNSLIIVREKLPGFAVNPSAGLQDNSYFSVASISAYNFGQGDFTIEAWIKPSSAGTIFGKKSTAGGSPDYAGFLMVLQPNGAIKLATDNGYGYYQIISVPTNVFNGDWHHISSVRINGTLSLYLNGQQINSITSSSLPSPLDVSNNLALLIGSVQQNQEPYIHYSGAISEARIWNIALQKLQIQQGMNSKLTGRESGLVGYWPLHTNGEDLSANKNNAASIGSVSFTNH